MEIASANAETIDTLGSFPNFHIDKCSTLKPPDHIRIGFRQNFGGAKVPLAHIPDIPRGQPSMKAWATQRR